ncbi:MAG: AAA family ATPase [Moraxellaceae bacterium]|nr:AAA family ATPase [Pseudobdellovibrionaceae bacterium]
MTSKLPFKHLLSTGIAGLDEILIGGIRQGNAVIVEGLPGTGRSTLALEFLFRGATHFDEAGYFISLNSSRMGILRNAAEFSWDLNALEERQLLKITEMDAKNLAEDIQNDCVRLRSEVQQFKIKRLAVDGLKGIKPHIEKIGQMTYGEALTKLFRVLQSLGTTCIFTTDLIRGSAIGESGVGDEQFLADTIFSMGNQARGKSVHGFIEIVKSRGQDFFSGRHSFKIMDGVGIIVYPRASVRRGAFNPRDFQATSIERLSVGNTTLDEMLGGGVYKGSITLFTGISGTGKTVAAMQFLMEGARVGEKGLLVSLDEHPQQIHRNADSLGIDLVSEEKKGNIILAYDGPLELNLDEHLQTIKNLVELHKVQRVVIDSLASYELVHPQEAREFIFSLTNYLKKRLIASFYSYESPELLGVSQISKDIKASAIVDNIVLLSYVEISTLLRRAITVPKSRGSKPAQRTKEYLIQQGGITILDDSTISDVPSVPQLPLSSYYGVLARSPTRTSPVIEESLASGTDLPISNMPKPAAQRKKRKI